MQVIKTTASEHPLLEESTTSVPSTISSNSGVVEIEIEAVSEPETQTKSEVEVDAKMNWDEIEAEWFEHGAEFQIY